MIKLLLTKICNKYNIPNDIMYDILEIYFKNNINKSIIDKNYNLNSKIYKTEWIYYMDKIAINKYRYDDEILEKIITSKYDYYKIKSSQAFLIYFKTLYDLVGTAPAFYPTHNLNVSRMHYTKYIL